MNVAVLFPRLIITNENGFEFSLEKQRVANPKAIAAQSLKSRSCGVRFYESGVADLLKHIFVNQFIAPDRFKAQLVLHNDSADWIQYAYTILPRAEESGCFVWLDENPRVRHLRFYPNDQDAQKDNNKIREIIEANV